MNPVIPNRVVLLADVATRPDVVATARRLAAEGYELMVVGLGAPAACLALSQAGVEARPHLGPPGPALDDLRPAVVVFGPSASSEGLAVPNRLCLDSTEPDARSTAVADLLAWVEDYLAPRVPRLCFPRT